MAKPLRIEYPGAFYHVTSRGNAQKNVFKSHKDREKFLLYVESAVVRYGAVVHITPGQAISDLTQNPWTGEGDPGLWTFGTNADPKLVEDVFVIFEYSAS